MDLRNFKQRLLELIEEFDGGVSSKFAGRIQSTPSTLQNYIQDRSLPSAEMVMKICLACGVTPNWLLFGWQPKYGGETQPMPETCRVVDMADAGEISDNDFVTLPVLRPEAFEMEGVTLINPLTVERITVVRAVPDSRLIAIHMPDNTMAPEVLEGDLLVVNLEERSAEALHGKLALARKGNGVVVRRVKNDRLCAINPPFETTIYLETSILGRVIQVIREGLS